MKRKILLSLLLASIISMTACSFTPTEVVEEPIATETDATSTTEEDKPKYDESDNSIEALLSRANKTYNGYLVSHYGGTKCHIVIGADHNNNPITISEEEITLERLSNCTLDAGDTCTECKKQYFDEELELPNKAEYIAKIEAENNPVIEEPVIEEPEILYGFTTGTIPLAVRDAYMYEIEAEEVKFDGKVFHLDEYDLEITVITDKVNGNLDVYLPDVENLGELVEASGFENLKYVSQYEDEEQLSVCAVYVIKDLKVGCIIHKFSNFNFDNSDGITMIPETCALAVAANSYYNVDEMSLEEFYKHVANINSEPFTLNSAFGEVTLTSEYVYDINKQFVPAEALDDILEAYVSLDEENNVKIVAVSKYKPDEITADNGFEYVSTVNTDDIEESNEDIESDVSAEMPRFYVAIKNNMYYVIDNSVVDVDNTLTVYAFYGLTDDVATQNYYDSILK